jgi:preprotein translocase subunit SecB
MNPVISEISLRLCLFAPMQRTDEKIESRLTLTEFSKEVKCVEDKCHMIVKMHFDLMRGIEKPNFIFQVCYEIIYTAQRQDDFEVIKDYVAIAHIIPYLRELAASMTTRANCNPLIIPPLNTLNLYNQYLETKKGAEENLEKSNNDDTDQKK